LIVDYRFDPVFPIAKGMLSWQQFKGKHLGLFAFIRSHGIPKRIAISPFWF